MENWHTNVSLKDVKPSEVLSQLDELGRNAIVTPSVEGCLVVYDRKCDESDLGALESLCADFVRATCLHGSCVLQRR